MSANKSSHTIKSIKVNMFRFNHHLGRAENKKCGQVLGGFVSRSARRDAACSQDLHTQASRGEDLSSEAAPEGERKQVTVLFADLKRPMELLADRDPRGSAQDPGSCAGTNNGGGLPLRGHGESGHAPRHVEPCSHVQSGRPQWQRGLSRTPSSWQSRTRCVRCRPRAVAAWLLLPPWAVSVRTSS